MANSHNIAPNFKIIINMKKYILVTWPDSQVLMDQDWFNECILMNDENHLNEVGGSAYFVPEERYKQL